ncbi:MAG: carboxymuconolactone decarboxylase family protein [Terracidiphilus sp.]
MYSTAYLQTSIRHGFTLAGSNPWGVLSTISTLDPRVPLVEREETPDELTELYDKLLADRGVVPNMFKALSGAPHLALGMATFLKALMREGALPGWYKELIATRVASLNRCDYCVSAHRYLALQRGATLGQVASYDNFENGPFTEKERAGFRYATLLHQSGHAVNEAAFEALAQHFDSEEILELTAVASAYEMLSRINSGLRIPVTPLPGSA